MNKNVLLIRHGRSGHNAGLTADMDSSITDFGAEHSGIVGKYLSKSKFMSLTDVAWYVSPYLRCLQTLRNILKGLDKNLIHPPIVHPFLGEHLYPFISVRIPERSKEFPEFDWSHYPQDHEFQAETNEIYITRIQKMYDLLGYNAVVVSHGLPVITLGLEAQGALQSMPLWDYSVNNCSLTWIQNGRKKWWGRNLHHEVEHNY